MATQYQINNSDDRKSPKIKKGHVFSRKRNFKDEKEKYLNMPLEEKRKFYFRRKHVGLDSVCTWNNYYHTHESRLQKLAAIFSTEGEVNTELNKKISLWRGDLTTLEIDAITNAAKQTLLGGAGVDGAIHAAAGEYLLAECKSLDGCATGDAKITGGYMLPARYVIHTVGPKGENPDKLESCYRTTLDVLKDNGLRTVAFPCVSTGIYGYKNEKAAPVAVRTVKKWLNQGDNANSVDRVIFCVFLPQDVDIYEEVLLQYFPITEKIQESGAGSDIRPAAAINKVSNEPYQSAFRESSKPKSRKNKAMCTLV